VSPRSRKFKEFKRADEDPPPTHVAQPLRALMRWSESSQHTPEAIRDGPRAEATMLYKIRVPVEGSLFLEPGARGCSYSSGASDLSYALAADDTGRVVSATIQAKVPVENIPKFSSIISPGEGDSKAHITIGGDRELYDRMVFEFRRLECNLAFALRGQALQRIDCERMEITFVPETDEERERVGLSGYKVTRGYKETAARIDASGFAQIIRRGSEFAEFDVHRRFYMTA
jgi:hypothetical protein